MLINDKYEMVCLMTEGMSCIMQLDVTTYLLIISSLAAKIRMFFRTVARTLGKSGRAGVKKSANKKASAALPANLKGNAAGAFFEKSF
ncbi:MAG: hypothetical protein EGQ96_00645 [Prevotella sp.]|nr:hypothetical protein [Prevotella sp.]